MGRALSAFAIAALLAAAPLPASAQDFAADRRVSAVTRQELLALTEALGHQVIDEGTGTNPALFVQVNSGVKYALVGTACDEAGAACQGLLIEARFDLPESAVADEILKLNRDHPVVNTSADFTTKTLIVSRYLVLDHGVSMGNLRANVEVLLSVLPDAYQAAGGTIDAAQ